MIGLITEWSDISGNFTNIQSSNKQSILLSNGLIELNEYSAKTVEKSSNRLPREYILTVCRAGCLVYYC